MARVSEPCRREWAGGRGVWGFAPSPPDVNADLRLSAEGHAFIFREETRGHLDRTRHPYWPGSTSGVTPGAGYDFKYRLREQIVEDLTRPGIDPATARALSLARARKVIRTKRAFPDQTRIIAKEHANDINITEEKQRLLLIWSIKEYENDVRRNVTVKLSQDEFDALVSFDMSRGHTKLREIARLLNSGQRAEAISRLRHLDDLLGAGFASRRQAEADIMTFGFGQAGTGTTGNSP